MIESQPWLERDRAMIDPLRTLGIEKGKEFNPDATARKIMNDAAQEARQWIDLQYEASLVPPFYEGGHWALPTAPGLMDGMQSSVANPIAIRSMDAERRTPWRSSAPSIREWARTI